MTTIKQQVREFTLSRRSGFLGYDREKLAAEILTIRIATLQEVVIGLDFLMKAVEGDDSIQAGRDFRFHYNQINNAENFRRVRGFYGIVTAKNNFVDDMKRMMENINEEVSRSLFTPPDELIRELARYLIEMKGVLRNDFGYTPKEFDELIGRESELGDENAPEVEYL